MKPLVTKRLRLRPLRPADVTQAYVAALNDPDVVRWTEARHTRWTPVGARAYAKRSNRAGESKLYAVFLRASGRHIGNVRLLNFHPTHRRAELGIMMFDKSVWGRGYGTEALRAVVKHAFATLGLHRIQADYYAPNRASARMFAKAGFRVEGVFKQHFAVDGRYVDSVRIAKLAPGKSR